jgi:PAS domain S-box-containing protein/diguanylate cyclase (GGDEF)-like protein
LTFFGQGGQVSDHFVAWRASGFTDTTQLEKIRTRLASFEAAFGHNGIALFDSDGRFRFSSQPDPGMGEHQRDALAAMQRRETLLIDFHPHGTAASEPMLGMMVPMTQGQGAAARVVGAMVFRIDADASLFAQLKHWPTSSSSGETVLARLQGDALEVLFASRQTMSIPLLPAARYPNLAALRALRGEHGVIRDAQDRFGNPVLAYGSKVPGTNWVLIVRLNQAEVDALLARLGRIALLAFAVLTLLSGWAIRNWWRNEVSEQRALLLGKDIERGMLEQRYDSLSHYSSDSILLLDDDGIVLEANQRVEEMYGYRSDELLGQSIFLLLTPERQTEYYQRRAEVLKVGKLRFESEHQRKDGTRLMVEVSAYAIELHGVRHLHLTIRDIGDRLLRERALRESEALYRGIIETSRDGFWITDLNGSLLEVNAAYCQRSGFSREELLSMHIGDLEAREQTPDGLQHGDKIIRVGGDLFETRHRAKDGSVWQVEVNTSYTPLAGGRFFVFLRDIRRRNRADALLRTRIQLADIAEKGDLDALLQASLDSAELYTGSHFGLFHFVDPEQQTLTLQTGSSNSSDRIGKSGNSQAWHQARGRHTPISQAGIWADCVRQRQTLIHNDSVALPEGQAPLQRGLLVPILHDDKVTAVLGVGNKASDYDAEDVAVVEQIASIAMELVARQRAEAALQESTRRLIEVQRIARMGNWEYDVLADKIAWSEQAREIMGIDPARPPFGYQEATTLYHPDDVPRFRQVIDQALQAGISSQLELRVVLPNGEQRPIWGTCQCVRNDAGRVTQLFGTVQDISERKQSEARLERATLFDALTGLPNARWLFQRIDPVIAGAGHATLALLLLNLDRFAQLNESLGRAVGDQVLISLARRWDALLPEQAMLVRLDADQFAVLWQQVGEAVEPDEDKSDVTMRIVETANALLGSMAEPIELSAQQAPVLLTVSIGIALYPGDAGDASALLHAAEDAMRSAKAERGNQMRFFDRRYAQNAINWFETEAALRLALEMDELFLLFQPQVDAANGRVVAAESLIRWRHGGEVVPPARFIHVVEATDLAEPVSRWVLNAACRQARQWLDRQHPLRVAVNIFSDHVTSGHLLDDVRQALTVNGLPANLLELEVVESSLLKNPDLAAQTLREIKRLGVGLALDDFGTGYSSLGYLKHYPFDVLKIDQLFARNVTRDPEDAAIVRSTIALAHNLGMRVLAEGVETEPQLRFMARYGCDQIQGYLTSRPLDPEVVETLVMERRDLRPAAIGLDRPLHTILIVEDEPIEAEMLSMLLADAGYAAECVTDFDTALEVMGRKRIDLIISDYYLGPITGVEVLERLRRLFPEVPRIMLSGADESSVVMEAVNRSGVLAFLRKPFDPDTLLATVQRLLEVQDSGKEVTR